MRHKFLLDFNIIYDAVRGVDRHDRPDPSATELLHLTARICHSITIHHDLLSRYYSVLKRLRAVRPTHLEPSFFVTQFLHNLAKRDLEFGELPELPAGVSIPAEDVVLVRAALISHPILITEDDPLKAAITLCPELGLQVMTIREALSFIKQE